MKLQPGLSAETVVGHFVHPTGPLATARASEVGQRFNAVLAKSPDLR